MHLQLKCLSDNFCQWTLHVCLHSLTVQLQTLLLRHSSSYAANCSRRTKQLLLHVVLTHCSSITLSESSYKQNKWKEIIFLPCLVLREARTKQKNQCVSTTQHCCRVQHNTSLIQRLYLSWIYENTK